MNRYVLRFKLMIAVDSPEEDVDTVCENLYSRLAELVQSEDHLMAAKIEGYQLPPTR